VIVNKEQAVPENIVEGAIFPHVHEVHQVNMDQLSEIRPCLAHSNTPICTDTYGRPVYEQYIFTTINEAHASGLFYNMMNYHDLYANECTYKDAIINTAQGRFVWFEEYQEDFDSEQYMIDSGYRAVGAPEEFSKAVEYHLQWNVGSELVSIYQESGTFKCKIRNANGDMVIIY
jgi:hypothetical protein